jgi:hypothetical protein
VADVQSIYACFCLIIGRKRPSDRGDEYLVNVCETPRSGILVIYDYGGAVPKVQTWAVILFFSHITRLTIKTAREEDE